MCLLIIFLPLLYPTLGCKVILCETVTIFILSNDQEHKKADEFWNVFGEYE
jgi:hypothetical protein